MMSIKPACISKYTEPEAVAEGGRRAEASIIRRSLLKASSTPRSNSDVEMNRTVLEAKDTSDLFYFIM